MNNLWACNILHQYSSMDVAYLDMWKKLVLQPSVVSLTVQWSFDIQPCGSNMFCLHICISSTKCINTYFIYIYAL